MEYTATNLLWDVEWPALSCWDLNLEFSGPFANQGDMNLAIIEIAPLSSTLKLCPGPSLLRASVFVLLVPFLYTILSYPYQRIEWT